MQFPEYLSRQRRTEHTWRHVQYQKNNSKSYYYVYIYVYCIEMTVNTYIMYQYIWHLRQHQTILLRSCPLMDLLASAYFMHCRRQLRQKIEFYDFLSNLIMWYIHKLITYWHYDLWEMWFAVGIWTWII